MTYAEFPLLSLILFTPLVGVAVLLFINKQNESVIRLIANVFVGLGFLVSLPLWFVYDSQNPQWQLVEQHQWIPSIGAQYLLGVDGFSVLLILLTTMMGVIAMVSSWTAIAVRVKEYYVFLLLLQTGMLGAFMALDFLLFFLFWEVMLVPMYFLIGIWGSDNRLYSAIKFFIYTLVGSVVMLLGILAVYFHYAEVTGVYTFDITRFHELNMPFDLQWWVFLAFFLGFAVKVPMFPFHTWLPDAHTEAPTIGSVDLAAILLKIGGYGIIRFSLPYFPDATQSLAPAIMGLAVVGVLYGALVAMVQPDIKRLVAYSSVAHMGFVVLGVFALNVQSTAGSVVQMVNHGLSTGALFILIGFMYERTHSRTIADYSGIAKVTPVFGGVFLVVALSSLALPGLNGFVGEFPILLGAFQTTPWAAVTATFGVIFAALYLLWAYQRMFHGPVGGRATGLTDLNLREKAVVVPLIAVIVAIGLYPKPLYDRVTPTVEQILAEVEAPDAVTSVDARD